MWDQLEWGSADTWTLIDTTIHTHRHTTCRGDGRLRPGGKGREGIREERRHKQGGAVIKPREQSDVLANQKTKKERNLRSKAQLDKNQLSIVSETKRKNDFEGPGDVKLKNVFFWMPNSASPWGTPGCSMPAVNESVFHHSRHKGLDWRRLFLSFTNETKSEEVFKTSVKDDRAWW